MIYFQIGILLLGSMSSFLVIFLTKKIGSEGKNRTLKIIAYVFFGVFLIRLFSGDRFDDMRMLNMPEYGTTVAVVFQILLRWATSASVLILCICPFTKSINLRNLIVVFALPILFINFILFSTNIHAFIGFQESIVNYRTFQFALELVVGFTLCAYLIFGNKHRLEFKSSPLKFFKNIFITLPLIILLCMPVYMFQQLFPPSELEVKFMSIGQHIWLGLTIVIMLSMHFGLRGRPEQEKFSALLLASVSMFFVYFGKIDILHFTVLNLPLHICNLATAIIPLALITKNKLLFNFTYYINVAGALVAILIPEAGFISSASFLIYAYEHSFAFMLPILYVSLGIMPRSTKKNFKYAIISFAIYFVFIAFVDVLLINVNTSVDYFYLNSNFIADKIKFLIPVRALNYTFFIGTWSITIYPLYWTVIFLGFSAALFLTMIIYREFYHFADMNAKIRDAVMKDKLDYVSFQNEIGKENLLQPVYKQEGVMISIKNFSKTYSGSASKSVDQLNLDIRDGEIFGFLGSNGAGKSTTIKSLVGILPFEDGSIEINGYNIRTQSLMAKKQLGYVPDNHAVYERLTGRQYVNYIADLYGVTKEDRQAITDDLVEKFSLTAAIDNPIKSYSHGMKQKITIIASLVHSPKLWVLDEPLTGLDPQSAQEVKEYMKEHAKKGNTVFFSSHIIEVVEKICDRVAIIKGGKLQGVYDLKEFSEQNKSLVEVFLDKSV